MNYDQLKAELAKPEYAAMSHAEAAATINAKTVATAQSRFGNLRTLANMLMPEEYAATKAGLAAAAAGNPMLADMLEMLRLPGDESGNGGGIDFGAAGVRAMIAQLAAAQAIPETAATKMLAYSATTINWAQQTLGGPVGDGHVQSAREEME